MTQKIYLIFDGNSFIHRAYHGMPAFSNKAGFPTHVITGVCSMINKVLKGFDYEHAVVAFDARGKNFRHDLNPDYKINRPPMADDMRVQLEPLKDIISAWGLPMMTIDGVEADDSMSTMAKRAEEAGYKVIMVTSDKDMNQMINDNIFILDTKATESKDKMILLDREGVKSKMGVYPERVIDLLSLVGDKADDIIGVNKCGDKTAVKWLDLYGDIDGIIENASLIKGKVGEYLQEAIDQGLLDLNRKLVKIKDDCDLEKSIEDFKGVMDEDKLLYLLNTYELRGFKKALNIIDHNATTAEMNVVTDKEQVADFVSTIKTLETVFLNHLNVKGVDYLIGTTKDSDIAYLIELSLFTHEFFNLIEYFTSDKYLISSSNTKEVLKALYKLTGSRKIFNIVCQDAKVVDYIQEGGRSKNATTEILNDAHSNFNLSELRETYKLSLKLAKWDKMTLEERIIVASEDLNVCRYIINNKEDDFDLRSESIDNQFLCVLAYMEHTGVKLDVDYLTSYGEELDIKIEDIQNKIYDIAGEEFSVGAPKEVGRILFDVIGIVSKKKSTGEEVLKAFVDEYPIAGLILEWRSLSKLKSTYVKGLIDKVDENNILHTTYNSTLTLTTRLSSENPNLQNLPQKTEDGRKIKEAFKAGKGKKIVKIDYSQIDLRGLAHFTQDIKLLEAYKQGADIHALTASKIFDVALEDVTYEQRRVAKTINFGLIYGMSDRALSAELSIEKKVAAKYSKNFFGYYKGVKPYFEKELDLAKENLYITTNTGRKIKALDLNSPNPHARSHAEKAAGNGSIQGTSAEIIKHAMINIFDVLQEENLDANLLMQVHDELVFEVAEEYAEAFADQMKTLMENAMLISVPLIAEYEIKDHY